MEDGSREVTPRFGVCDPCEIPGGDPITILSVVSCLAPTVVSPEPNSGPQPRQAFRTCRATAMMMRLHQWSKTRQTLYPF